MAPATELRIYAFGDVGLNETLRLWPRRAAQKHAALAALRSSSPQKHGLSILGDSSKVTESCQRDPTAAVLLSSLQAFADRIVKLDAGPEHTLAMLGSGEVLAWGSDADGRLGIGGPEGRLVATPVRVACDDSVQDVAAGGAHSLALRHDGVVLSWGSNSDGQLGSGGLAPRNRPLPVVSGGLPAIIAVAAGKAHSVLLAITGHVYCFGRGREGQLGRCVALQCAPHLVPSISAQRVTAIAAAAHVTVLLAENGAVWLCGEGSCGVLGQGGAKGGKCLNLPQRLPLEHQDANATVVSTVPPARYGTAESYLYPKKLHKPPAPIEPSAAVVDVSVGWGHAVFTDASGRVFAVGLNSKGQLGLGHTGEQSLRVPRQVCFQDAGGSTEGVPAVDSVAVGTTFSAALSQGELFLWGSLPNAPPPQLQKGPPPPRPASDLGGPTPTAVPPGAFGDPEARVAGISACGSGLYAFVEVPVRAPPPPKPRFRVTLGIFGLDNAGKTTLISALGNQIEPATQPTIGFSPAQLTGGDYDVALYDLGGGKKIRGIWPAYYADTHAIVYVVDAADPQRFGESRECLWKILKDPRAAGKPLLVLGNKQDLGDAASADAIAQSLGTHEFPCTHSVHTCCALQREHPHHANIDAAVDWLLGEVVRDYDELSTRVKMQGLEERERQRREFLTKAERIERDKL